VAFFPAGMQPACYRCNKCLLRMHCESITVAAGLRLTHFGCIPVMYVASTSGQGVKAVSKTKWLSSRLANLLLISTLVPVELSSIRAIAQSAIDDVHINPPSTSHVLARTGKMELALNTAVIPPIKVDVDLVLVPVTITDPQERLILGLREKNFEVFEGKSRQEIRHFSAEDAPVSLGVIFDMSGSMNTKIDRAREAGAGHAWRSERFGAVSGTAANPAW